MPFPQGIELGIGWFEGMGFCYWGKTDRWRCESHNRGQGPLLTGDRTLAPGDKETDEVKEVIDYTTTYDFQTKQNLEPLRSMALTQ